MLLAARCLLVSLVICAALAPGRAQDLHFSHLNAVPMQINPAYTGLTEKRARVGVSYRSQWDNFTAGFKTATLSADFKPHHTGNGAAGVGLFVNSDRAGDLNFGTQQIGLNGAYLMALDGGRTSVSFGLQSVFNFQRLDWTAIDAFEEERGDILANGGRAQYLSVGTGLALFQRLNRRVAWFVGAGGANLNRPDAGFLDDGNTGGAQLTYRRWSGHGGAEIHFGRFNSVRPSIIYLHQGPNRQMKVGSYYRFRPDRGISTDAELAAHFGAFVRHSFYNDEWTSDAIVFAVRVDWQETVITFSFDTNVSKLRVASNGVGGPEISLVQEFDWGERRQRRSKVECPTFQY